jgi:HEAT repeat protein
MPLLRCLPDENKYLRADAAEALAQLGWTPTADEHGVWYYIARREFTRCYDFGATAIGPLQTVLRYGFSAFNYETLPAIAVLGDLAGEEAIDDLLALLANPETPVRMAVITALRKVNGQKVIEALVTLLAQQNQANVEAAAIDTLAEIGDHTAVPALREIIDIYEMRLHHLQQNLGKIGYIEATQEIIAQRRACEQVVEKAKTALATLEHCSSQVPS